MGDADLPKSRRALLLIDFINPLDFPEAKQLAAPALEAAKATRHLAHAARQRGIPVIYANDNFGRWQSDFSTIEERLRKSSGTGAAMAQMLRHRRGDLTILKPMHSAFFGTPLDIILDRMGARSIVIAGLATDICIQLTAADAFLRGLQVHAPQDCTAAETEDKKDRALAYMRDILKCDTRPWKSLRWHRR